MWAAAFARPGDDVRDAIAVEIPCGDIRTAGEVRTIRGEILDRLGRRRVEDPHPSRHARTAGRDDVRATVVVEVRCRDPNAAPLVGVEREEIGDRRASLAIDHFHTRSATLIGADDDVRSAVVVHVTNRQGQPTRVGGFHGEEVH